MFTTFKNKIKFKNSYRSFFFKYDKEFKIKPNFFFPEIRLKEKQYCLFNIDKL